MGIEKKVTKELPFQILRVICLIPILMWPLIAYGSVFIFDGPNAVKNPTFSYLLFFIVNAYPLYLIGTVYLSNKLYYKTKMLSYGLLTWPIIALLILWIIW